MEAFSTHVVLLIVCLIAKHEYVSGEMDAETVYEFLSKRLDDLLLRTGNMEQRISNMDDRLSKVESKFDGKEVTTVSNSQKVMAHASQTDVDFTKNFRMQSIAFQRMLSVEKLILKETRKNIDAQFSSLKQDILGEISEFKNASDVLQSEVRASIEAFRSKVEDNLNVLADDIASVQNETQQSFNALTLELQTSVSLLQSNFSASVSNIHEKIASESSMMSLKYSSLSSSLSSSVSNIYSKISSESSSVSSKYSSLSSSLSSLSSKYSSLSSSLSSETSSLSSRIYSLSTRMDEAHERKVAFSARKYGITKEVYSSEETIIFDQTRYNNGNGYNSESGIFTAPKSGTYLFAVTIEATVRGKGHVIMVKNGYFIGEAIAAMYYDNTGTQLVVTFLYKGEKVWIEAASSKSTSKQYLAPFRTQFVGVLID